MKLRSILESVQDLEARLEREYNLEYLSISEGPKHVELHNIRVRPSERNHGSGTKVVEAIKDYAASIGKRVILFAEPDRGKKSALSRFYKRNDFKKPGRFKDYSIPQHTHVWHPE